MHFLLFIGLFAVCHLVANLVVEVIRAVFTSSDKRQHGDLLGIGGNIAVMLLWLLIAFGVPLFLEFDTGGLNIAAISELVHHPHTSIPAAIPFLPGGAWTRTTWIVLILGGVVIQALLGLIGLALGIMVILMILIAASRAIKPQPKPILFQTPPPKPVPSPTIEMPHVQSSNSKQGDNTVNLKDFAQQWPNWFEKKLASSSNIQTVEQFMESLSPTLRDQLVIAVAPELQKGTAQIAAQQLKAIEELARLKLETDLQQEALKRRLPHAIDRLQMVLETIYQMQESWRVYEERFDERFCPIARLFMAEQFRLLLDGLQATGTFHSAVMKSLEDLTQNVAPLTAPATASPAIVKSPVVGWTKINVQPEPGFEPLDEQDFPPNHPQSPAPSRNGSH